MDLSQWIELNPTINIVRSTKKFYGSYPYKLTYRVVGAYLLPICKDLDYIFKRLYNSVRTKPTKQDHATIEVFFDLYVDKSNGIKWRTEGSTVSLFFEDEQTAYGIASGALLSSVSALRSITRIQNDSDRAVIESGKIIMTKPTEYRYKVIIREGYRQMQSRQALGKYLQTIRSEIKISDKMLHGMISNYKYFHSCYFYVNDPKIVSMIALVAPSLVKHVQEVVIT